MKSLLKELQDKFELEEQQRKGAIAAAKANPTPPKVYNPKDIRVEPTEVDIMLMNEYNNHIYQGD